MEHSRWLADRRNAFAHRLLDEGDRGTTARGQLGLSSTTKPSKRRLAAWVRSPESWPRNMTRSPACANPERADEAEDTGDQRGRVIIPCPAKHRGRQRTTRSIAQKAGDRGPEREYDQRVSGGIFLLNGAQTSGTCDRTDEPLSASGRPDGYTGKLGCRFAVIEPTRC